MSGAVSEAHAVHDLSRVATVVLGVCNGGYEHVGLHWTADRPGLSLRWSISDVSLLIFVVYKTFDSVQYLLESMLGRETPRETRVAYGLVLAAFLALYLLLHVFSALHFLYEDVLVARDPVWLTENYARHVLTVADEASSGASYASHAAGAYDDALSGEGALRRFGVFTCGGDDGTVRADARVTLYAWLYSLTCLCLAFDASWVVSVLLMPCASCVDGSGW